MRAKNIEVFAILPIRAGGHEPARNPITLPGVLLTYGEKSFLVDRDDQIRGIYNQSLVRDRQRLQEDIRFLQHAS